MNESLLWYLPLLFFLSALLYSSVGHGGASAYLAILVLTDYPLSQIASVVLMLNIIVSSGGFFHFWRAGHFSGSLLLPFILTSIPAAFFGGSIQVSSKVLSLVLFIALVFAAMRFLFLRKAIQPLGVISPRLVYSIGLPAGLILGFMAGLVGVGGGIFLSPLILLLGWADAKRTAAVSAGFILVNSLSGLIPRLLVVIPDADLLIPLGLAVFLGGQIGSRMGANRLPAQRIQQLLGMVLLIASVKLLPGLLR